MIEVEFSLTIVKRDYGDDLWLAEPLSILDLSSARDSSWFAADTVARLTRDFLDKQALGNFWRHQSPREVEVDAVRVKLQPVRRQKAWLGPVTIDLPLVRWCQTPTMHIAFLPTLGIEVVAETAEELAERLSREAHMTLQRTKVASSLYELAQLQRCTKLEVAHEQNRITTLTSKEKQQEIERLYKQSEKGPPILPQVALDLVQWVHKNNPQVFELEEDARRIAELLTARPRHSVLLVGPLGVGKTAAIQAMLRDRVKLGLDQIPFWSTTGARLVAGMSGFGMWEQRCQKLCAELAENEAIIHLGNLVELMQVGRSEMRSQGIASFLRPRIRRGDITAIAECTPEQLVAIEREDSQLLSAFTVVHLSVPGEQRIRQIVEKYVANAPQCKSSRLTSEGLDKLLRLHRRYAAYSASPSREVRFTQSLLSERRARSEWGPAAASAPRVVTEREVTRSFAAETGLPLWLLDEAESFDVSALHDWLSARVLGQPEAVEILVNLVASIKAGLARPHRPLASLLFIGPTGVGKTEMAKSLAEFLFSDSARLLRFDMSEYSDPISVQRLIGGAFEKEGLLTAKIREQPFSVLLFDEVEKADPLFFDLLLQVLGEARLTDGAGRVANFSNTAIVMTSNLGAAAYQRMAVGFGDEGADATGEAQDAAKQHFSRAVEQFLRPELFNRIDRIVPFAPLNQETIKRVANRQLELLRGRDGVRFRKLDLEIDDAVVTQLAQVGFDARYGARPLKRAIERDLLVPLAERLNSYRFEQSLRAGVGMDEQRIACQVVADGEDEFQEKHSHINLANSFLSLRRRTQALQGCQPRINMGNEYFRLSRCLHQLVRRKKPSSPELERRVRELNTQLDALRIHEQALEQLEAEVAEATESLLVELYRHRPIDFVAWGELHERLEQRLRAEMMRIYARRFNVPNTVVLTVHSENVRLMQKIAQAYWDVCQSWTTQMQLWRLQVTQSPQRESSSAIPWSSASTAHFHWQFLHPNSPPNSPHKTLWYCPPKLTTDPSRVPWLDRERVDDPAEFFEQVPPRGMLCLAMEMEGPGIAGRLSLESGWNEWIGPARPSYLLVDVIAGKIDDYRPPLGIDRRDGLPVMELQRVYNEVAGKVVDKRGGKDVYRLEEPLNEVLQVMMEDQLEQALLGMLDNER